MRKRERERERKEKGKVGERAKVNIRPVRAGVRDPLTLCLRWGAVGCAEGGNR